MSKFKNNGEWIMPQHEGVSAEQKIINIAVIEQADAVKSSLVGALIKQSNIFHQNQVVFEQEMDSNDQGSERGITIYAKNCSVMNGNIKINITGTPGHTDFSSEVDRIVKAVGCVISLEDSVEWLTIQTRFVLQKVLEYNLNRILTVNGIYKEGRRIEEVKDEVLELFMELNANYEKLDLPTI